MKSFDPPAIYPTLRYDDAPAAIRFLVDAFGFEADAVHEGDRGRISHALLGFGPGLVMVSSRTSDPSRDPFDLGPGCLYVAVDDPDAHYERAKKAGAEIVMELTDQSYGSREYAARDPEGHVWCFGTYRPGRAAGA
jgi:uncharacterized glyoxalase superfamily protein PhnB